MNVLRRSSLVLIGFLALCFFVAWTGAQVSPGIAPADWYQLLQKPSWNPPAWVFGPVWTVLYASMAVAAWLVWRSSGWRDARFAHTLFAIQLVLNGVWSQLFFGMQRVDLALIEIVVLLLAIVAATAAFFRHSKTAGWLMVPYILWVLFATALNAAIWMLN
ncbi:MAG: TspO/MBR family protein [Balneolaceae bacterium]